MRRINRLRVFTARMASLFLACGVALATGSHPAASAKDNTVKKSDSSRVSSQQLYSLDIALFGPFALLDCSEGGKTLRLLAPDVPLHERVKVGKLGKASPLSKGEYKMLNVRAADRTDLVNPVRAAQPLIFPVEDACGGIAGKPCPYVCIELPRPKQIVPWDADPMRVLRPGENPAKIPWKRLARVLILRYEVDSFQGIQLSQTGSNAKLDLELDQHRAEGILTVALDPLAADGTDWHQEARDTFQVLIGLLGLRGHLEFPGKEVTQRYERNKVLIPGVLPTELTNSLPEVDAQGTHGDCLGAQVLVMDIQPE